MTIAKGTRLGPYEIVAPIGAGGMGEVWRARDTRLDRTVAIKMLPIEFAANAQLRQRLDREAKAISQLNDPHICTLYDVGHDDGRDYLVMEYLEGETLADRIDRGPLPVADVIRYGIEIAKALERAHAAGIIHRDLKPGNVMISKSGAKLLDFGLAKSTTSSVLGPRSSVMETEHKPLTAEGTILGTFQYMAPEQLEGIEADARTDIFALGTILYEMTTGKRAFQGKTRTSLIAAIVDRDPPPISSLQPLTPRAFERIVQTCLAKDPADRWQSAHDVRVQLEWLASSIEAESIGPAKRNRWPWAIAALLAITTAALGAMFIRERNAIRDQMPIRTSIVPNPGSLFELFIEGGPAQISPDGKKIAYVASVGGSGLGVSPNRTLWVRTLDSPTARQLSGTEGASQPFWSPDSKYIAFFADGLLRKIEWSGGAAVTLCSTEPIRGGAWTRNGKIIFGRAGGPIAWVPASGGTAVDVTSLAGGNRDTSHRFPSLLPDEDHFLYFAGPHIADDSRDAVYVASMSGKKQKLVLVTNGSAVYWNGFVLYARDRILTAQRFDTKKFEVVGDPIPIQEASIDFDTTTGRSLISIANDGTLLYRTGEGIRPSQMLWFDRSGKLQDTTGSTQRYGQLAISRDGKTIAYSTIPRANIWLFDLARGTSRRLTFSNARETAPIWSPDGTRVVFSSVRKNNAYDLFVQDVRTGAEQLLVENNNDKTASSWSADGKTIFYTETGTSGRPDIMYFSFADNKSRPYLATPFGEGIARISPDGKWVAYQSTETPPIQVYLAPFPPTGAKWQVSVSGGTAPRWRADGKEIFFLSGGHMMSAPVSTSPSVEIGNPVKLFDVFFGGTTSWDVTADGQRFLINGRANDIGPAAPLTLVQHFDRVLRDASEKRD